jgi:hypothetical protein
MHGGNMGGLNILLLAATSWQYKGNILLAAMRGHLEGTFFL